MFKQIFNIFKSEVTIIKKSELRKENIVKHLVSRHSNGNTSLQQAKYITENVLKQKQKELFSYKFL